MKLAGGVCIVTGSASGIGAATAIALATKGARVVVNYSKSEDAARATHDAIATRSAARAFDREQPLGKFRAPASCKLP